MRPFFLQDFTRLTSTRWRPCSRECIYNLHTLQACILHLMRLVRISRLTSSFRSATSQLFSLCVFSRSLCLFCRLEKNPSLPMKEFEAMLYEFQTDYNQTHFVRNDTFKKAANDIQGPARKIFIEFLERSCTAEFSGFLLYKELGRRLKKTNPVGEILLQAPRPLAWYYAPRGQPDCANIRTLPAVKVPRQLV